MQIHNHLPLFLENMHRWKTAPSARELAENYLVPTQPQLGIIFDPDEAESIALDLRTMDWKNYRERVLRMDSAEQLSRFKRHLDAIHEYFGFELRGEVNLFGAFEYMDGYARYEKGGHSVFLGIDEAFENGSYVDILTLHELTHVAREGQSSVWRGFGLDPEMTNEEFRKQQPVIEHLFGEGFSCAISEKLLPDQHAHLYSYQSEEGLKHAYREVERLNRVIHAEIRAEDGHYGNLYSSSHYGGNVPSLAQYVWGWHWVKNLARDLYDGDYQRMIGTCSKEWVEHALQFNLPRI